MFNDNLNKHDSTLGSVVISGASSGIGEACAIYLDKLGYQVFAGVRQEADGRNLIRKGSGRIIPIILDVTNKASIIAALNRVKTTLYPTGLTALINNAGIVIPGPLEFIPIDALKKQLEVNVIGLLALSQACLPLLRQASGRIINMSSPSGKVSLPMLGTYSASKFAVEGLSNALRIELQPWGIDVCIIEPAAIKTSAWGKLTSDASQIWNSFPQEAQDLYAPGFKIMQQMATESEQHGMSGEIVAKTVVKILSAKKPKTRYTVGLDAKLAALCVRVLPDRVLDKVITLFVVTGYPTTASVKTAYEQQGASQKKFQSQPKVQNLVQK